MVKMLQSIWMTAVLGALMFAGTLFFAWKMMPVPAATTAAHAAADQEETDTGYALASNVDLDALVSDLHRRQRELDERETQLRLLEQRILAESNNIVSLKSGVDKTVNEIDERIIAIKAGEERGLRKIAKVMDSTEPAGAVKILEDQKTETAAKILSFMKDEKISQILDAMRQTGEPGARRANDILKLIGTIVPPPAA